MLEIAITVFVLMIISLILLAVAMCRAKTPDFGAIKPKVPDLPPVEYHYRNFGGVAYKGYPIPK